MASLEELDNTLPDYYTLSNETLILISQVGDETLYFYDELGPHTTIILLSQPKCHATKNIFLEFMINLGVTVLDIKAEYTNDTNYRLDKRSIKVIMNLLNEYRYKKILTHPATVTNVQDRELYKLINEYMRITNNTNHYTYNIVSSNTNTPNGIKKGILELYCKSQNKNGKLDENLCKKYINIASQISGIRKI